MNPAIKTGADLPKGLESVIRANDSLVVRMVMDMFSKRHCCRCADMCFRFEVDPFGNNYLNAYGPALEGLTTFVVRLQRKFWWDVAKGELSLSPQKLFRLPVAPPQKPQTPAVAVT